MDYLRSERKTRMGSSRWPRRSAEGQEAGWERVMVLEGKSSYSACGMGFTSSLKHGRLHHYESKATAFRLRLIITREKKVVYAHNVDLSWATSVLEPWVLMDFFALRHPSENSATFLNTSHKSIGTYVMWQSLCLSSKYKFLEKIMGFGGIRHSCRPALIFAYTNSMTWGNSHDFSTWASSSVKWD